MKTNTHFWSYLDQFFLEKEIFRKNAMEKNKTKHSCSKTILFRKTCRYGIMWKNVVEPCRLQKTMCSMRISMLDSLSYKHTLIMCNIFRSSTAMFVWTRHNVTLDIRCLPCCIFLTRKDRWIPLSKWFKNRVIMWDTASYLKIWAGYCEL